MTTLVLRALIVLGFWRLADGGYYREGRWQWAFWRSEPLTLPGDAPFTHDYCSP